MQVQEYLEKHKLSRKIEEAVNAAVRAKAPDPVLYISNHMMRVVPSTITKLKARQIIDSRGNPTVEVDLYTNKGMFRASVPSGASTGVYEAVELRDGDGSKYLGKGVLKAVTSINEKISPILVDMDPTKQTEIDKAMIDLDNTENKGELGANAILAVSMAVCKAGAAAKDIPLYQHIADLSGNSNFVLPVPAFNIINGGKHAGNKLAFQEFMILPIGASSFGEAMQMGCETYHHLKSADRTLDAPDLLDDYYLNLLDWSSTNVLCVALGNTVYLWDASDSSISELLIADDEEGPVTSVGWAPDGRQIAVGFNNYVVQLWDSASDKHAVIKEKYGIDACNVGDEGGFAPNISSSKEGLDLIRDAIERAGYTGKIKIGMDVAASEFYKDEKYNLDFKTPDNSGEDIKTGEEMIEMYKELCSEYPIVSIEDPFDQDDWENTKTLTGTGICQVVGDDLLVTNPKRVSKAIEECTCNALLLKVNQIGTVTEAIEAVKMAKDANWGVMASHRSGETEDCFIADLSVGLATGQIKTGAPCRSERLAKYNQLLRIEEDLGDKAVYAGQNWRPTS